jgi:hypothetical protein
MITIANILSEMWPGQSWSIDGDDYSKLRWSNNNSEPKPTLEQIEAVRAEAEVSIGWKRIRNERQKLLTNSDWTQLNNAPLTSERVSAWATYRQELRDIPQEFDDPDFVIWPNQPE